MQQKKEANKRKRHTKGRVQHRKHNNKESTTPTQTTTRNVSPTEHTNGGGSGTHQSFPFDNGLVDVGKIEFLIKLHDRDGKELDFGLFFRHSGQGAQQTNKLQKFLFLHGTACHACQDLRHRGHGFNGRHGVEFTDPQQIRKELAIVPADHDRMLGSGVVDRKLKQRVVEAHGTGVNHFQRVVGNGGGGSGGGSGGGGGGQPFLVVQQLQPRRLDVTSLGVPLRERFKGDAAAVALVRSGLCVRPRFVTVDGGDDVMAGRVDDAIEGGITGITGITRGGDRTQMAERSQYATNVPEQGVLVDQT